MLRVSGSLVGWDRPDRRAGRVGGLSGGLVRFYKSQCKSRDKYYLLFEERHSRYLLYRGKVQVVWNTSSGSFKEKLVE